jgi:hypothetical protein
MEDSILLTIFALILIGYVVLYIWGRRYLEHFAPRFSPDGTPQRSAKELQRPILAPGEKEVHVDQGSVERSAVFQNEGSREASQKQISDAMTRYPLDWSTQGPNSQLFQDGQVANDEPSWNLKAYKGVKAVNAATAQFPTADIPSPFGPNSPPQYSGLASANEITPLEADAVPLEEKEEKLLKTYEPKASKGLLEYAVEDVKHLIERIYDARGEVAEVVKSKQGSNVWEVIEVREKSPTIVWEDEAQQMRGENSIPVPYAASDALNPFLGARDSARKGKNDLSPQLQRMYEPTYPVPAWN